MINDLAHREYQKLVADKLKTLLRLPVEIEWRAMQEQRSLYGPRVDIAVGPFVYNSSCIPDEHDCLVSQWKIPIQAMLDYHRQNVTSLSWDNCQTSFDSLCYKNKTSRCFLAIEIEDTGSREHLIGTAINAMALGRLGIVVTSTRDKLKTFVRQRRYLWFLSPATNLDTDNLLILNREQFVNSFNIKL
ncbi:hypothetical protein ACFLV6_01270 [Chloroflexota bacterium]